MGRRFGGTVTGASTDIDGEPAVRCELKFIYAGVYVTAYAYVCTTSTR